MASSYDVRYSMFQITGETWPDATPCDGEPAPGPAGSEEHFTVSGLAPDTQYFFRLVAVDENGNESSPSNQVEARTLTSSDSPAVAWVRDGLAGEDQDWTCFPYQLSAAWAAVAGATGYQYSIGTAAGASDVAGWQSPPGMRDTLVTRTGLELVAGETYYFAVRALVEGGCSGYTSSDGITVDTGRPSSQVRALPGSVCSEVTVNWTGMDDLSGIGSYDVQVEDSSYGSWTDWITGTSDTSGSFSGQAGHTYFFRSMARDRAGNSEDYPSEADSRTEVLAGVPSVAFVKDGLEAKDAAWTSSVGELSANWAIVPGADGYEYAIGTEPDARDVVDWTSAGGETQVTRSGLGLAEGQSYFFSVRGLRGTCFGPAKCSNGITTDWSPPVSFVDPLPETTYSQWEYDALLSISWHDEDASGVAALEIQSRMGETGEWKDLRVNINADSIKFFGAVGSTYYFRSRARDLLGHQEEYPDLPDAHTTVLYSGTPGPPPPPVNPMSKMALHLVTRANRTCTTLPVIQDVNSLNRIWNLTGPGADVDVFFVVFDFDSISAVEFGLEWPEDWGSALFTACTPVTQTGDIVDPRDGVRLSYQDCRVSSRRGGTTPAYWTMCYTWLTPVSDGQINISPYDFSNDLCVSDCRDPQFRSHQYPRWIFCAGVNVVPYEGSPFCCGQSSPGTPARP